MLSVFFCRTDNVRRISPQTSSFSFLTGQTAPAQDSTNSQHSTPAPNKANNTVHRQLMESFGGELVTTRSAGSSLSRMILDLKGRGINPTHFLVVNFNYHSGLSSRQRAHFNKTFFRLINLRKFERALNPTGDEDDKVHIKWISPNITQSAFYYTVCRFEDTYMRQLTQLQMREAFHAAVKSLKDEGVTEDHVRVSFIPAKNAAFEIDLESGHAESVGSVGSPSTAALVAVHGAAASGGAGALAVGAGEHNETLTAAQWEEGVAAAGELESGSSSDASDH
jgi:hypothetical protein